MITKWKVFNFKSVRKETQLDFAPLTIFAGANSSGKSTIIQSILLVAQTVAHRVSSRSVILNGALARLGQFDDVCSAGSEANQIVVGFECDAPPNKGRPAFPDASSMRGEPFFYRYHEGPVENVACELSFDADPSSPRRDVLQLQPRLFSAILSSRGRLDDSDPDSAASCRIAIVNVEHTGETQTSKMRRLGLGELGTDAAKDSLEWNVDLDDVSLEEIHDRLQTAEPVGCLLRHFVPASLSLRIDRTVEDSRLAGALLCEGRPSLRRRRPSRADDILISDAAIDVLRSELRKSPGDDDRREEVLEHLCAVREGQPLTVGAWLDRVRELPDSIRYMLRRSLGDDPDLRDRLAQALQHDKKPDYELVPYRLPEVLAAGIGYIERLFTTSLKYLGPLRDEPKAMYPLSGVHDPFDVGLRGERTAAVLDIHKARQIWYIPSSQFENSEVDSSRALRSLEAAVVDWLQYLGVADSVKSHDRGKFGHELKVYLGDSARAHDLTHVGVGVSQVLPILVMSLLAEPDTTLIFEQPELHLHPKVQTLLGDFFLSMTALGKQCIVETHSEYLINRLRFRTAAAMKGNPWVSATKVYFVERPPDGSIFREVKINEYGAILDWPEGFFDQTQREAEEILRAAMQKKKMGRDRGTRHD